MTSPLFTNAGILTLSTTGAGNNLTISSAGQMILSGFNCSTYDNGVVLTVNASGVLGCDNGDGGASSTLGASQTIPGASVEAQQIYNEISKSVVLPEGEAPTVLNISDAEAVKKDNAALWTSIMVTKCRSSLSRANWSSIGPVIRR